MFGNFRVGTGNGNLEGGGGVVMRLDMGSFILFLVPCLVLDEYYTWEFKRGVYSLVWLGGIHGDLAERWQYKL